MSCELSQADVAHAADLPVNALRRLEDGEGPVDAWHLTRIADVLGVGVGGLAGQRPQW